MRMFLCSVFDSKVGMYNAPMAIRSLGEAIRSFSDAVANDGPIKNHKADYSLWVLGSYDDNTGELEPEIKRLIGADELG